MTEIEKLAKDRPMMTRQKWEQLQRVGPSVGDPGYVPYCGCPGLYRARRGKTGFECIFGRCGVGRTVNGVDMFDQTAPDGSGYDWPDDLADARAHLQSQGAE